MKNKRSIYSWALYDWANSAFSTTVAAGFFPVFFKTYWSNGADATITTARLASVISISSLLIALISPTLGAMADLRGLKKIFCVVFMLLGSASCAWMGFIGQGEWFLAACAFGLAMMAFNASCVFYDSLLPSVASGKDMDWVSSLGYSLGYLGGGVLFAVNVAMFLKPAWFNLPDGVSAVQWSFISVAVWWFLFSWPLILFVPEKKFHLSTGSVSLWKMTSDSVQRLWQTCKKISKNKNMLYFLLGFWLYIDGVYTVMTMAVDFGISLGFASQDLIAALLVTQFVGFPFAIGFGYLAKIWGTKKPILICLLFYVLTVIGATFMSKAWHFYVLAAVIGMVQGGVQSLSRSLFGRMISAEESGEYFGLFNLIGKFASILGPILVAGTVLVTGQSRMGLLGLIVIFCIGGFLLFKVQEPE